MNKDRQQAGSTALRLNIAERYEIFRSSDKREPGEDANYFIIRKAVRRFLHHNTQFLRVEKGQSHHIGLRNDKVLS